MIASICHFRGLYSKSTGTKQSMEHKRNGEDKEVGYVHDKEVKFKLRTKGVLLCEPRAILNFFSLNTIFIDCIHYSPRSLKIETLDMMHNIPSSEAASWRFLSKVRKLQARTAAGFIEENSPALILTLSLLNSSYSIIFCLNKLLRCLVANKLIRRDY